MDLQLTGKRVLITGSTAGIGKGIAEQFLKEGAAVIINGRSEERVGQTVKDLSQYGKVEGIAADLANAEDSKKLIEQAEKNGEIDILINNLAFFEPKDFKDVSDEEWNDYFQVNIMSAVRLSRYFLPKMIERNSGRLLNIASEAGFKPVPSMIPYSMTKTSLISLSRGLAELTKGTKVTVNAVLPGPTWTEGVENFLKGAAEAENKDLESFTKDYFKENEPSSLIQRFATIEEVASTVVFLASDKASAINGSSQRVEGGIIRSI